MLLLFKCSHTQCLVTLTSSGSSFANNSSTGTVAWTNPGNASAHDGNNATASSSVGALSTKQTNYLVAQHFGFGISSSATICGIKVEIERSSTGAGVGSSVSDNSVMLINQSNAFAGNNMAAGGNWPSSAAYQVYGGSSSTWSAGLTAADINSNNFGVAISASLNAGVVVVGLGANVDHIRVTVYYNVSLPITVTHFTATPLNDKVELNWSATNQSETDYFMLQKSSDVISWKNIDSVKSYAAVTEYHAYDLFPGNINYYRLAEINFNGTHLLSPIVSANMENINDPGIKILINPPAKEAIIQTKEEIIDIKLFDVNGRQLMIDYAGHNNNAILHTSTLKPGLYVIRTWTKKNCYAGKLVVF